MLECELGLFYLFSIELKKTIIVFMWHLISI